MEDQLTGPGSGTWVPVWIYTCIVLLTGLVSILFAYFYFLLLNFSRTKLLQLANGGGSKDKIERYLQRYNRMLNTVVVLEISSKALFILCLFVILIRSFELTRLEALLPTFILGVIWFIFFCRILPAELGAHREEQILLRILPFLHGLSYIFHPVIMPLNYFRRLLRKRLLNVDPSYEAEQFTEEILDAVEEGEREGVILEEEADMIEGVVRLHNCEVSEIMTPRIDMVCTDAKTPIMEIIQQVIELGHSRIPIYQDDRDTIIGILYVKDLLNYWPENKEDLPPLTEIVRKPYFIPETKRVSELLAEFRENKLHIAIVLDEYGGTAGLVTNEDILEEIVGEIVDEYDQEEEAELKILNPGKAEASAKLHIDELNEEMEIALPESDDYDTLGGFVFARLGKVPSKGEVVLHDNVVLKVIDVDERRINRISIEIIEPEEKAEKKQS
ncbi:MAG: hemolysin family protein [Planctomycetes bacterium]|nr:hemolysin family protein [Planctomycetota bacterium]